MFRLRSVYGEWLKVPSSANGGLGSLARELGLQLLETRRRDLVVLHLHAP